MKRDAPGSRLIGLLLAIVVGMAGLPAADAQVLQSDLRAKIMLRVLTFDRQLKARVGRELIIGVLYNERSGASLADKDEIHKALERLTQVKVSGLPFRVSALAYPGARAQKEAIRRRQIDALYVAPGLDSELGAISAASRVLKVPTMASSRGYVEGGLSFAVIIVNRRPRLVVNLPASKVEGMDLSAEMLGLADVIR